MYSDYSLALLLPDILWFAGKILCESPSSGKADVDRAVKAAQEAFQIWSQVPAIERARIMQSAARKLAVSVIMCLSSSLGYFSLYMW